MYIKEKRKNPRSAVFIMDLLHIAVGILIVILSVISFLNPENNMVLFPIIFFFASFLNFINGFYKVKQSDRHSKTKLSGIALMFFGLLLFALCFVSAVSIWRG